jgi:hypothetical protein
MTSEEDGSVFSSFGNGKPGLGVMGKLPDADSPVAAGELWASDSTGLPAVA